MYRLKDNTCFKDFACTILFIIICIIVVQIVRTLDPQARGFAFAIVPIIVSFSWQEGIQGEWIKTKRTKRILLVVRLLWGAGIEGYLIW